MKVAIIGRSEWLYNVATLLVEKGYEIPLVITAKEAPEYKYTAKDYESFARDNGAHYIYTPKINTPDVIAQIKNCGPIDIAISVNYSGVIEDEVIDLFPVGVLNAHGGDLPKYRGNACQAWAIVNGEERIGLCVHKMKGGELDSGDIIARDYYQLNTNTRVGEVYEWMEELIPVLMLEALDKLSVNNQYVLDVQSTAAADISRCYPRNPTDGRIKWTEAGINVLRLINASSEPFAGAFCFLNDEKVIIWRAELFDDSEIYYAVPGQVLNVAMPDQSVIVATGNGKLRITEIEHNGIRTTSPSAIIKSIRSRLG